MNEKELEKLKQILDYCEESKDENYYIINIDKAIKLVKELIKEIEAKTSKSKIKEE